MTGLHFFFVAPKRSSPRRSPAFWGAPACTWLRSLLFFFSFDRRNRSSVVRSLAFAGSGPPVPYDQGPAVFFRSFPNVDLKPVTVFCDGLNCTAGALPGSLGCASAAPNVRGRFFLIAPLHVGLQPGHVGHCGVTGLHCTTLPECSRFYQIGSEAVGASAEAVFSAAERSPRLPRHPHWEPLGADGRSGRKVVAKWITGSVSLGARRHNACYV